MDQDSQYYLDVLHELIDIGTGMARQVHQQAIAQAKKGALSPDFAVPYQVIARSICQSIMLAEKIAKGGQRLPARRQSAVRQRIIDAVASAPSAGDDRSIRLSEYRPTLLQTVPRIRGQ